MPKGNKDPHLLSTTLWYSQLNLHFHLHLTDNNLPLRMITFRPLIYNPPPVQPISSTTRLQYNSSKVACSICSAPGSSPSNLAAGTPELTHWEEGVGSNCTFGNSLGRGRLLCRVKRTFGSSLGRGGPLCGVKRTLSRLPNEASGPCTAPKPPKRYISGLTSCIPAFKRPSTCSRLSDGKCPR